MGIWAPEGTIGKETAGPVNSNPSSNLEPIPKFDTYHHSMLFLLKYGLYPEEEGERG